MLKEFQNQFAKDTPSDIFYSILDCILNDIIELNPRLAAFYNYIAKLPELYKVLEENI